MRLATSPQLWPPIPSATAHRPICGRSISASSLCMRTLPREVALAPRQLKGSCNSERLTMGLPDIVLRQEQFIECALISVLEGRAKQLAKSAFGIYRHDVQQLRIEILQH